MTSARKTDTTLFYFIFAHRAWKSPFCPHL